MKTSAEVRAELADLERQRRGNEEAVAVADRGIAEESVRAFRKVDGADKRRKEHHAARTAALEQLEHIALVEATLQLELEEAEQAETRAGREASAGEAEKFAEGLPTIFKECDRHLANFHAAYTAWRYAPRGPRNGTCPLKKWS